MADREEVLGQLIAETDARDKEWCNVHKDDPCERCGSRSDVRVVLIGGLGRRTCLCAICADRSFEVTRAWHDGYEAALRDYKSRPWWKRLIL